MGSELSQRHRGTDSLPAARSTRVTERMDEWARPHAPPPGVRQPVRSHDHVGGAGVLGAHPGSGYKMQLLYRVLRVKLNTGPGTVKDGDLCA